LTRALFQFIDRGSEDDVALRHNCEALEREERLARGRWDGYAGGDAPGLRFETAAWIHARPA